MRLTARGAREEGNLPELIDEDFPVRGRAFRDLGEAEWSEVEPIIRERHFALNWRCGYAPGNRWDEPPSDT